MNNIGDNVISAIIVPIQKEVHPGQSKGFIAICNGFFNHFLMYNPYCNTSKSNIVIAIDITCNSNILQSNFIF
jgi:hypothetical protein